MKITKRVAFTKSGKCRGKVVKRGRSRRRICMVTMEVKRRGRRRR